MTSNEILKSDVLDILFDNRNKQYGAYTLRKNYNNRLSLSLGISLSSVLLIFFMARNTNLSSGMIPTDKEYVRISEVVPPDIKKPEKLVQPKAQPVQQVRQQQYTRIIIKPDITVKNTIADQQTLLNSAISTKTTAGPSVTGNPIINNDPVHTNSGQSGSKQELKPSREPEFPGGQEAWINFLRKNLIAPSELEIDDKKTVKVRFVVDVDGSVTGFEVIQSAGRSFDNEVIRVLKKMPKWKPAIQDGEPVVKYYTQPVTFIGVEQ